MHYLGFYPLPADVLPWVIGLGIMLFAVMMAYFIYFLPLALFKKDHKEVSSELPPVSVIICARNEEDHLFEYLPKVLTQNYPDFEVVVVNDGSHDQSEIVLNEYARVFPHLKVVHFHEDEYYKHGKKMALLVGIKTARHEHLIFTDADCYPASDRWLRQMASGFTPTKKIVIGHSAFEKEKSFLNKLIRFDALWHTIMFFSAAIRNCAYMATGRNLAYTKQLFFANKGFAGHYHLASGDDDLFINQASDHQNTNICLHPDSFTHTPARKTFRDWKWQKARHISTSYHYKFKNKFKFFIFYSLLYFYYFSLIAFISIFPNFFIYALISLAFKSIVLWIVLYVPSKKLKENGLAMHAVYMEFIILVLYPYFHLLQKRYNPGKWTN